MTSKFDRSNFALCNMAANSAEILHTENDDDGNYLDDGTASSSNNDPADGEENWSDEDESEASETEEALIYDFESNFFDLVNNKVTDTEAFFDNEQYIIKYVPRQSESKECTCKQHPQSSNDIRLAEEKQFNHADCQTDDLLYVINTNENQRLEPPTSDEAVRIEINHLRKARESLVNQRKELAEIRKKNPDSDSDSDTERKIYGCEEAIEAIDSAIDFKNEVICGRDFILSNDFAPGMTEANLVSRLTSLSLSDLQRLLCKYFSKVIELRYSTKRLEAQVEDMEMRHDQVKRRVRKYQNDLREIEDENASRIKDIIKFYSHNPGVELGEYLHHSKGAKSARKKQQDLELSLTELLVRHGYLRDGADYDVKQVAKMLGIDPLQLQLCQVEDEDDKNPVLPMTRLTTLGSLHPSQGLSRRMREVINNRRERPDTPMDAGNRSHQWGSSPARRGHTSSGGHSVSNFPKSHAHRHHQEQGEEYQTPLNVSGSDRHPRRDGSSSNHRHLVNNNEHHIRHGYNINGHGHHHDYAANANVANADASYLPSDRRYESYPVPSTSYRPNVGAEVQRHDKKITVIPRQRNHHQHR